MMNVCFCSSPQSFSLHPNNNNYHFLSPKSPSFPTTTSSSLRLQIQHFTGNSSFLSFNPLRVAVFKKEFVMKQQQQQSRFGSAVCYSAPLSPQNLQWISTISSAILVLARGTAVQKSFLVPLFALQAPSNIISWIKGDYGLWTAFLTLVVRLFLYIPGELELPFIALLLVIVAPYQAMKLRGTQEGVILSLVIAGYLAFQHFSRAGGVQKAFERGSIIATLAIICILAVPCLLLI